MARLPTLLVCCCLLIQIVSCDPVTGFGTTTISLTAPADATIAAVTGTLESNGDVVIRADNVVESISSSPSMRESCVFPTATLGAVCANDATAPLTATVTTTGAFTLNITTIDAEWRYGDPLTGQVSPDNIFVRYLNLTSIIDQIDEGHDRALLLDVSVPGAIRCNLEPTRCTAARMTIGRGLCPTPERFDVITSASFSSTATVPVSKSDLLDVIADGEEWIYFMADMPLDVRDFKPNCTTVKDIELSLHIGPSSTTYFGPLFFMTTVSLLPAIIVIIYTEYSLRQSQKRLNSLSPQAKAVLHSELVTVAGDYGAPQTFNSMTSAISPASPSHLASNPPVSVDVEADQDADATASEEKAADPAVTKKEATAELIASPTTAAAASRVGKQNRKDRLRSMRLYAVALLLAGCFYSIPSFLVVGYGLFVAKIGKTEDVCFYNARCYRPLGKIKTFNAISSNIPYIVLGALFVLIAYRRLRLRLHREVETANERHTSVDIQGKLGTPKNSIMLRMAGGVALIFVGVLSSAYHVCPSSFNFLFDSSFMIVFAIILWLSLFANRHKLLAHPIKTVFSLAGILFINVVGTWLLQSSREELSILWGLLIVFVFVVFVLHIGTVYYRRAVDPDFPPHVVSVVWIPMFFRSVGSLSFKCSKWGWSELPGILMFLLQFIIILAFTVHAGSAMISDDVDPPQDAFSKFLMGVTIISFGLEYIYYVLRKFLLSYKRPEETISKLNWLYLVLGLGCFGAGMVFFTILDVSNKTSPAAFSKELNKDCLLFDFYDAHDVWHLLSGFGLFFVLLHLDTLDEPLWGVKRFKENGKTSNLVIF